MIESIVNAVAEAYGLSHELTRKMLWTALVLFLYVAARRISVRVIGRRFEDVSTRYRFTFTLLEIGSWSRV